MNVETIGLWAGAVWNALNDANGSLTVKGLKKTTKLKEKEVFATLTKNKIIINGLPTKYKIKNNKLYVNNIAMYEIIGNNKLLMLAGGGIIFEHE